MGQNKVAWNTSINGITISRYDYYGNDVFDWINSWDDINNAQNKGQVTIYSDDGNELLIGTINNLSYNPGSGGLFLITLEYPLIDQYNPTPNEIVLVSFSPRGATGPGFVETWSGTQVVLGEDFSNFNVGINLGTNDVVEFDGRVILKGNNGSTILESVGMTIEYTGTLIALPGGQQYLSDLTILDVSGTITTNTSGDISVSDVDLYKVWLSYIDSLSATPNVLTLRVNNELTYSLQYKYFTTVRYFNTL